MLIIGHRGAKGLVLENTIPSFLRAQEIGVDMIEFDVHRIRSGEVPVYHDIRLERLTDGKGLIRDINRRDLENLRLPDDSPIPMLEDVLAAIDPAMPINIELKGEGSALPVARILKEEISAGRRNLEGILVSSFNHRELVLVCQEIPGIGIGLLATGIPLNCRRLTEGFGALSLNISHEFVNQEYIDEIHEVGMNVFVYTVNHEDQMKSFREMGVDGIFTDRPDIAIQYR